LLLSRATLVTRTSGSHIKHANTSHRLPLSSLPFTSSPPTPSPTFPSYLL
jgi:hypothetical protein